MPVLGISFCKFVYPFIFNSRSFTERVESISKQSEYGKPIWMPAKFYLSEMLPYLADYLDMTKPDNATACIWSLSNDMFQKWVGNNAIWQLCTRRSGKQIEIPFQFSSIQLVLFRNGIGMLIFQAQPNSIDENNWFDFIHYFRYARGQWKVSLKAERLQPENLNEEERQAFRAFSFCGKLQTHLELLMMTIRLPNDLDGWADDIFVRGQLLPFTSLFVDSSPKSKNYKNDAIMLNRFRHFYHSGQPIYLTMEDEQLNHSALLQYVKRSWFTFSLEGGGFISLNPPKEIFFRETLPAHLRDQYFMLFILSLYQRFSLIAISANVTQYWLCQLPEEKHRAFEDIKRAFLEFTARGFFSQVMQLDNHHRYYQKWHSIFQIDQLYNEVQSEANEMMSYLYIQQSQRLEKRINLIGSFIGIPALFIGFLGINLIGVTAPDGISIWTALLISMFGTLFLGGLLYFILQRGIHSK